MARAMRSRRRSSSSSLCQFIGDSPLQGSISAASPRGRVAYSTDLVYGNDPREAAMNRIERAIEKIILNSRWLVAPFLLGLIVGLVALLYAFIVKLGDFVLHVRGTPEEEIIVGVLKLVDLSLTANLLLIVVCSGYENFVARIDPAKLVNWPEGLIGIGFSGLKQKLLGSIAAIAAVNVLEWFMDIDRSVDNIKLGWVVGILLAFAVAMLILALADRISEPHASKGSSE
jgi:uncharacterized protein (TIGR00645 family)